MMFCLSHLGVVNYVVLCIYYQDALQEFDTWLFLIVFYEPLIIIKLEYFRVKSISFGINELIQK